MSKSGQPPPPQTALLSGYHPDPLQTHGFLGGGVLYGVEKNG